MYSATKKNQPFSFLYSRFPRSPTASTPLSPKMPSAATPTATSKSLTIRPSRLKDFLLVISLLLIIYLLFRGPPSPPASVSRAVSSGSPTTRHHLLFSIASSASSLPLRASYIRLWYNRSTTRAFAFLDVNSSLSYDPSLPPVILCKDTSRFPYTFKGGLRSAIRVARLVKEAVDLEQPNVRWFVFGDDDTVFFVENLVKILSKYDHNQWYYIGSNSESYVQNSRYSFNMAFGGGGFAVSYSLGKVLARVLDSCLVRYAHLYGSDARIFSCLAELGVGLTHEPGFHQVDMRGDLFGMLSAHPLSPLVSLHHLDTADPLFPSRSKALAAEHFFDAANVDQTRMLQQTVCYDSTNSLTVSVAWGYSIQVFEGNELLPDLLSLQKTFKPWRRAAKSENSLYMFNVRDYPKDKCKRPLVFFMESVVSDDHGVWSTYTRQGLGDCSRAEVIMHLRLVRVFSHILEPDIEQMKVSRRQCCDVYPSFNESMDISIRQCRADELISMHF